MIDWYTNVYNNVYLGAQLANLDKKTAKIYTEETIKLLGLDNKKQRFGRTFWWTTTTCPNWKSNCS